MTWLDDLMEGDVEIGIGHPAHLPDPLQLGQDLECDEDLTPEMRETAGLPVLYQDSFHRLVTPRGSLTDDPEYGTDVTDDLSRGMTPAELGSLPAKYTAEVLKDERASASRMRVEVVQADDHMSLSLVGETADGPFRQTRSIDTAGEIVSEEER